MAKTQQMRIFPMELTPMISHLENLTLLKLLHQLLQQILTLKQEAGEPLGPDLL
jgi:hypothetical protein